MSEPKFTPGPWRIRQSKDKAFGYPIEIEADAEALIYGATPRYTVSHHATSAELAPVRLRVADGPSNTRNSVASITKLDNTGHGQSEAGERDGQTARKADADLIAAAPTLYAAIEDMLASASPNAAEHPAMAAAWANARVALARARGEYV